MTTNVTESPFGTWRSPISAQRIATGSLRLGSVTLVAESAYWLEGRAAEGGRNVLVRCRADGRAEDATPPPFNVRTGAHEYGGGAYRVMQDMVWFANFADQRIYAQRRGEPPRALTPEGPWRYADLVVDTRRRRLLAVRETHETGGEPASALVSLDTATGAAQVLAEGHDFYSNPCLSEDGRHLAWLSWDHPRMPWDGTELWVAAIDTHGALGRATRVAGGPDESVFQPQWAIDGALYFVSDPTGWWNLHRWAGEEVTPLCPMQAEFGQPQWQFGMSTYGFDATGAIVCAYCGGGRWRLARLNPDSGRLAPIELPYTQFQDVSVGDHRAAFLAGAPDRPTAVVSLDLASGRWDVLREASTLDFDAGYLSRPDRITFPTGDGETAHGFLYPPRNPGYRAPSTERPPLIVVGHGGPTGAASDALHLPTQFWTSRGFAVLDVDYRGSTGYGRAYRRLLQGRWGIADVADCVSGARHLIATGQVDQQRLVIRGSSAGGYTALAALTFHDVFKAGASHYGISDLEALAQETHKFESRYMDWLVGPYPAARAVYRARSPIHHAEHLSCAVIFFQGLADKVVPPNQAQRMVNALQRRGLPVAYVAFEGEQHGFRRSETMRRALEAELYFYGRVFGFQPADRLEPVPIANLP
ncbi:MAG: S9 family peptidase [Gammaproteobacteria bacterium]|nr:S9 family peptidase [Gammaproteobacteria bacterium]NIR83566.1 S9 family peptidase [Gammaproteobacteria bacterium]NIR91488.1 S9 family peptidase [Gammaproteobacteria bacterium]NIU04728.1 S9 family peptidase [Gammaproteobacteria bacterium]NIV51770.1 prolyl oligopeptidase family serine peptidase [Gammaproteobacteria bacterium]